MLSPALVGWADRLTAALRSHHPAHYVATFVPSAAGDELVLAAQHWGAGHGNDLAADGSASAPLVGSVVGRVFRTGSPSLVSDTRHDPEYRDFPGGANLSELAVPIRVDGVIVGVVNLEHPHPGIYGIADLDRVMAILAEAVADFPALAPGSRG